MQSDHGGIDLEDSVPHRTATKSLRLEPINLEVNPTALGPYGKKDTSRTGTEISCQGGSPIRVGEDPEAVIVFDPGQKILGKGLESLEYLDLGEPRIDRLFQSMAEMLEVLVLLQET
jgi:hypothetical protein